MEYLEGVFVQSKYVAQIWVYGSSFKRYLVAIVVPDPDVLFPYAKEKGLPEDLPALCKDDSIKKLIFDDLTATAKDAKVIFRIFFFRHFLISCNHSFFFFF